MKKILTIALVFFAGITASAQSGLGIMGGFTSSSSSARNFDTKSVSLYHVGVAYRLNLGPVAVQPALLYQVKGTTLDAALAGTSVAQLDTKTGYLELPVQVQVSLADLLVANPYVFAEPFVGYGLTNKTEELKNDWKNANISRVEYGLGLGLGVNVLKRLQLSAKYFWNFGSLCSDGETIDTGVIYNTVQQAFKKGKNFNGISVSLVLFL